MFLIDKDTDVALFRNGSFVDSLATCRDRGYIPLVLPQIHDLMYDNVAFRTSAHTSLSVRIIGQTKVGAKVAVYVHDLGSWADPKYWRKTALVYDMLPIPKGEFLKLIEADEEQFSDGTYRVRVLPLEDDRTYICSLGIEEVKCNRDYLAYFGSRKRLDRFLAGEQDSTPGKASGREKRYDPIFITGFGHAIADVGLASTLRSRIYGEKNGWEAPYPVFGRRSQTPLLDRFKSYLPQAFQ